ncbi:MAG: hypothetical protein COB60_12105, partial [Flavobacteriaceae bacterium]
MKKTSKSISALVTLLLIFSFAIYSQESNCTADLISENDTEHKKAGESGTFYRLKLINTGTEETSFNIGIVNSTETNIKKTSNNVDLTFEFRNKDFKKNKTLSLGHHKKDRIVHLKSEEESVFYVKINVPSGTKIGSTNTSIVTV